MAIINNSQGLFVTLPINTKYHPTNPIVEDFPTHYDQNGYGGFMAIDSSISEVNSATSLTGKYELIIPEKRRKLGMLIYDVNPSISSFYQCTDVAACSWEEVNFRFRYFYGPTAPAVSNIQVGEKWFDTIVGSEYTYLPIAEGSSEKAWVDIDHIGEGETFSGYMTVDLANTYYVNIGGDEMTGSLTAHKVFRGSKDINFDEDEFVTKSFVFANFPESSGGVFTAHITGTSARFSGGITAAKFNATQAITEDTQLATKKYVDDNTIRGVDFHIDDQPNPFSTDADAISISGGSNINILFDQSTNPNRYVISSTLEVADQFVNIDGDTMTGTLTGTDASFDSITASNGFVRTLTGNYIDISSLGDFGSQIRVASNSSLGMPYYSSLMNSLDLWSRLHLIGGGGATGYSLRITTSTSGSTLEEAEGRAIFDQGHTYGVAISPYGLVDINDGSAGISIFGTNLYTGENNQSDPTMSYDGITSSYYGMLTLGMDGRGYIPRMFSKRKSSLANTFTDEEFITKRVSIMKPLSDAPTSQDIKYNQIWDVNIGQNDFLFASLTEEKMGFSFPVNITVRIAGGADSAPGNMSTRWFVKNFNSVSPTNGTDITITVDRDKEISFASGDQDCADHNISTDTITLGGYIEANASADGRKVWAFLDVSPTPLT